LSWDQQQQEKNMDTGLYRHYLNQYVKEAVQNSDGSTAGISGYLWEKKVTGILVKHRAEKNKALAEARRAFDEHRHWPVPIVISHLGLNLKEFGMKL
jgi:hypothetical protein